ncbi:hypothetical protein L1077_21555 [Pseudoalteromonas luteoviolacea]|uniref:hypothetical protein n=1 Tax=Pseudoalteromonas luteoviolacea TaxID=43657 RepID=UPI001F3FC4D8|nr:hypothetical protein [Pseudoalteromonas luteoviolacea]MCF6442020.1 hypothetical protein [Pseudoalteromonas luteoviolacea]
MIAYPRELPYPQLDTLNYKQRKNILETEMASGYARRRPINQSVPTIMTATWKLSANKAVIFEAFVAKGLNVLSPFLLKIPTPRGLVEHEVRFKTSPFESYKPLENDKWQYQANIEVRRYQIASEEQAATAMARPNDFEGFVGEVSTLINSFVES